LFVNLLIHFFLFDFNKKTIVVSASYIDLSSSLKRQI
jgi:hypothetical protein